MLFVNEEYRKEGIGTFLIKKIEEYAKENNIIGIRVGTFDFQAKRFYEKLGYKLFGQIEDCPPFTIHYDFKKVLIKDKNKFPLPPKKITDKDI